MLSLNVRMVYVFLAAAGFAASIRFGTLKYFRVIAR